MRSTSVKAERLTRDRALHRIGIGAGLGVFAAAAQVIVGPKGMAPLIGWDVLALTYVCLTWRIIWPLNGEQTAQRATRRDPTRPASYALLVPATAASLVAVGVLLFDAAHTSGTTRTLRVALGITSIVISWSLAQTFFALHYARLYYGAQEGGIHFNQPDRPSYADFAYLALTIGATAQVSDTTISSSQIRQVVLLHALTSFAFSILILATAVNLVTGLSR